MQLMPLAQCQLQCGRFKLDLSQPQVMGILNVTPDSFSDGGQHHQKDQAIQHALQMMQDGATIIDIGGESTRPNASPVALEEEIRRVIPVVEALSKYDVIISIDTSQPEVMRAAVQAGAHIWNDVRALTRPQALETAAELNIPVVLMHMRGEPTNMNQLDQYHDVTEEVIQELQQRLDQAVAVGVRKENIIIDPGFGFAKNAQQNFQLLNEFWKLNRMGYPILSGLSRKRFIGEALDGVPAQERAVGSVMGHVLSIQQGANIVRAHDVKATSDAIKVWNRMQNN
ncbi:dihydropteroate synthase [Acinetobacter gyllenbergii]|uniref:Dihydropteroate synthase n=1 Tax=Acinetobacter gyllenbergii CIP 110306 = MTCC 11365 TaxID=1217657 RepID=A0A829HMD4_9GAMM|nr:dihydropteroate synthase [Acinetobacter gyllenbergii]EPF90549.1 dihydropteroate synthase [Acinetobacter gyllenbergii CIP 110306 = MTCC 11365]EPH31007.1 Dihydropteroate synthase [Acinetobacter gyllenbergii CIP 110306 = MTCC 11365]ESK35738.1 dihydropteroate synthase [Acinetobacter gyllenbergii NIPH 230]MCU4582462.1 dihydropteroate synthase [Acinetobacter gyllenbergii]OBY73838.1 dihydropteroate synthase [Acinetobacter gyllenbergii]